MAADLERKEKFSEKARACPCGAGETSGNAERTSGNAEGISENTERTSGNAEGTSENTELMSAEEEEQIALKEERETMNHAGHRHRSRTPAEQKALITRLKRIEGQVRGIEKMVENNAYCPDILVQVSAATSALNSFNKVLLQCHIRGCVAEDIREGNDETIDELCKVLQKLMK